MLTIKNTRLGSFVVAVNRGAVTVTGMEGTLKMVHSSAMGLRGELRGPLAGSASRNPLNAEAGPPAGIAPRPHGYPRDQNDVTIDMRVARLLCSRLCHDLVGSSGAIHNGVELMSEEGGADPAALSLIAASSRHLNNRLAFYRVAFGLGGGANGMMTLAEARELARGVIASNRVELDWRIDARGGNGERVSFPVDEIRLLLGLVLIGADALPRGGTLCVRCVNTAAGTEVTIRAQGSRAGLSEDLLAAMNPDVPANALTSRTVHGYVAAALARRLETAVDIDRTNADQVTLTALPQRPRQPETIPFPAHGASV